MISQYFMESLLFSSPDEFPIPRNLSACFSDLNDGRRVAKIIKRFARHSDDMRFAKLQCVRGLDAEWKLLRCPTKYCLPANAHIVGRRTGTPLTASVGDIYISGQSFTSFVRSPVPYHSRTFDLGSVRLRATEATQRAGAIPTFLMTTTVPQQ